MRYFLIGAVFVAICSIGELSVSNSERSILLGLPANQSPLTSYAQANKNRKWSRTEFIKLVIGKTQEEIILLVGQPIKKTEDSWSYLEKTWRDHNVMDHCVKIHWIDGVARGLTYHDISPGEDAD